VTNPFSVNQQVLKAFHACKAATIPLPATQPAAKPLLAKQQTNDYT